MFDFVEHANFEVAYARLEVNFYGLMVESDDGLCLLADCFFDGLSFFVGKMSVLGSQGCSFFHVDRVKFFLVMEVMAMRSSDVEVGE